MTGFATALNEITLVLFTTLAPSGAVAYVIMGMAALRAQGDDDDGDEHRHNGDCGDDQKHGEGRLRHGSYCYRWGGRLRPWCAVREHFLHATAPWGVIMVQSRLI